VFEVAARRSRSGPGTASWSARSRRPPSRAWTAGRPSCLGDRPGPRTPRARRARPL